ncbi:MAG: glutamine-hydrolyzing carbamoyl-phosphate synthase small subunit [Lachnospiraceae bacterium]|nr:glutamine-hydrolyzing carbamoyl-phosphate synthase small subunit [Lachnospiraceae bacterium]
MLREYDRKLIFEDGTEYPGYSFGDPSERVCEIVFNTSMAGYQEILSDPSYTDQAVVMTYPLIGNYGMAAEDYETKTPSMGALIVSEYNGEPSNFRSRASLGDVMKQYRIPGISGVDTRKLARSIRNEGSRKVLLTDIATSREEGMERLRNASIPTDAVARVSCRAMHTEEGGSRKFHVAAIDCGMKQNIVRCLNRRGCRVTVVPYDTTAEAIEQLHPDGVFISNGPGNPEDVPCVIETVRALRGKYPIFGICLGHQIICLSYGARCFKLKFGHRGGNHPVRNTASGKIEITSQNHSYAVEEESLKGTPLTVTHVNLLDHTIEGVCCEADRIFSVQYHPESAPGPEDSAYLFDRFIQMMQEEKKNA